MPTRSTVRSRRKETRFVPAPTYSIEIKYQEGTAWRSVHSRFVNLGTGGLAVMCRERLNAALPVQVTIRGPRKERSVKVRGQVRWRKCCGVQTPLNSAPVMHGIRFDRLSSQQIRSIESLSARGILKAA